MRGDEGLETLAAADAAVGFRLGIEEAGPL